MKRKVTKSKHFLKDLLKAEKRGFNISELNIVVDKLANGEKLEEKYQDHPLVGNYNDFRECHIRPNWLLIYLINDKEVELYLFRTGTHSDLFKS